MRQKTDRRTRGEAGDQMPASRVNLYDEVTAKIIAELEGGRIPWVQPWGTPNGQGAAAAPGLPRNAVTGRAYSGVNVLILWGALFEHGYPAQGWLTFRQVRSEEHTSELQSLMRISYAVFCLKTTNYRRHTTRHNND